MRTEAPLLAPIFRSNGQARLLSTLLLTGDELSVTDLARRAGLAYPTVHREVAADVARDLVPAAGRGAPGPVAAAHQCRRQIWHRP